MFRYRNLKSILNTSIRCYNTIIPTSEKGVTKITMNFEPLNLMGKDFIESLTKSIKDVESDKSINTLILDSSCKVFSGGLNLQEFHGASTEDLQAFWTSFRELWITIYKSRLATITSISGQCLAGGCLLAIATDARIISSNCKIGLNEAAFGLVVPPWAIKVMFDIVGRRLGEKAVSLGELYTAEEALSMGLVDIMVATPEDIEVEVMKEAKKWSAPGRAPTKALVRKEFVEWFLSDEAADINSFIQLVGNDRTQTAIGAYLQALANKRKK